MPPKVRASKKAVQSAKKISSVKKAVPKTTAKSSMRPPTRGKKPATAGKNMTRPGPLGPRNGSGSIPFAGPGPMGQGIY